MFIIPHKHAKLGPSWIQARHPVCPCLAQAWHPAWSQAGCYTSQAWNKLETSCFPSWFSADSMLNPSCLSMLNPSYSQPGARLDVTRPKLETSLKQAVSQADFQQIPCLIQAVFPCLIQADSSLLPRNIWTTAKLYPSYFHALSKSMPSLSQAI